MAGLIPRDDFVGLDEVAHLCTGGEAPWLKSQVETYAEFARLKSYGDRGRRQMYALGERCRERCGERCNATSRCVAVAPRVPRRSSPP